MYVDRMTGILSLYSGIVESESIPNNRFSLNDGWRWLAHLLSMKTTKFTVLMLETFLKVTLALFVFVFLFSYLFRYGSSSFFFS
jgi:hypothetical protein